MSILIRQATADDLPWVARELDQFSDFFGTSKPLFVNNEYSRKHLKIWIRSHLFLVAERDKELMGLITGLVHNHMYNPDIKVLTETLWWVSEKHRGSRAGLMLLNKFCEWGKENVDWVFMTLEHNSPINEKTLTRRGFRLSEKQYMLEVN